MPSIEKIRGAYEEKGRAVARAFVAKTLARTRVTPNVVTVSGTALNLVAAALAYEHEFLAAAVVFIIGSVLDALDGAVAKVTGKVTPFGAFLDSTLDRVSEGLMLGGLGLMFAADDRTGPLAACFLALASSYLVSYTRARAEALGVQCKTGLASRVERVVLLSIGLLLAQLWPVALEVIVYVLAATATLTVAQRVLHVRRCLRERTA